MTETEKVLAQIQRQQSPRLLAVLVRIFGVHNLQMAEDVLQEAFYKALVELRDNGIPENPQGWLMQTAKRQALDSIRRVDTQHKFADDLSFMLQSNWIVNATLEQQFTEERIKDDQLRMLFLCCHKSIPTENRLPFMLKTLCGLSIDAISKALLIKSATVKKRLLRTKQKLKDCAFVIPDERELPNALDSVHTALYLLFNEGFHCTHVSSRIDLMLCHDALGQATLLAEETRDSE